MKRLRALFLVTAVSVAADLIVVELLVARWAYRAFC